MDYPITLFFRTELIKYGPNHENSDDDDNDNDDDDDGCRVYLA
jgi:hypothetical protein